MAGGLTALGLKLFRQLSGQLEYGDVVRFRRAPGAVAESTDDARFMWVRTQWEDAAGYDVSVAICIHEGLPWNIGDWIYKHPAIFEVVE